MASIASGPSSSRSPIAVAQASKSESARSIHTKPSRSMWSGASGPRTGAIANGLDMATGTTGAGGASVSVAMPETCSSDWSRGGGSEISSSGIVTGWRWRWRRPWMIFGSAAIVSVRSPPPSCMRITEPGPTPSRARSAITSEPGSR